jgi:hypothetical protein
LGRNEREKKRAEEDHPFIPEIDLLIVNVKLSNREKCHVIHLVLLKQGQLR